ncbi:MAG: EamA family transporter [Candidatus Sericytochromatia bacterium]
MMSFTNKLIISFTGVYLIWGSTYLAVKISLEGFPSFLMAAIRFFIAGLLFFLIAYFKGDSRPTLKDWKNGLITGFMMNFCGQGLNFLVAKEVPSSIVALICAIAPLLITFFDSLFFTKQKLSIFVISGLVIGFTGVINLLSPDSSMNFNYLLTLPIIISSIFWALGSLIPKKLDMNSSSFVNLGTQLLSSSFFFIISSLLMGELTNFSFTQVSIKSFLALIYLITFGSIVVFTCYDWLLKNYDASKVSTYGFVNPVIAVIMGNLFGNEPITFKVILSASIILFGVIIIIASKSKTKINFDFNKEKNQLSYE